MDTGAREKTLDEIKAEILRRSEKHLSPFGHVRLEDARAVAQALKSLDRDHWAEEWCKTGLPYEAKGDELAQRQASRGEIGEAYYNAFELCRMGRYPCASTPGKQQAYQHSLRIFRKAARHFDVPLEVVELPFKGGKLIGYLQVPKTAAKPPVVMHWGGVDGWKEDRQRASGMLHGLGIATLTVDMPGTGESPVRYTDPDAERGYSAFIDHLAQRKDVDGGRIGVWGGSFGAYWAARLAFVEEKRLKAAVFQGGSVHYGFQEKWLRPAFATGASGYLFGPASMFEARSQAMGVETLEEFLEIAPSLSLLDRGLLDRPSAPLLGVNGKLDDMAPVDDIYLLMEHGNPKEARIYPKGSHMGRTPGMPEDQITKLITGWLSLRLAGYK
jgi:pimeloyl-ACP methyl ester carboxylesterase